MKAIGERCFDLFSIWPVWVERVGIYQYSGNMRQLMLISAKDRRFVKQDFVRHGDDQHASLSLIAQDNAFGGHLNQEPLLNFLSHKEDMLVRHVRAQIWVTRRHRCFHLLTSVRTGGGEVVALRQCLRKFHHLFVGNRQLRRLQQGIDSLHHEQQRFQRILRRLLRKPPGDLRFYSPRQGVYLRISERNQSDRRSGWELASHFRRDLIAERTSAYTLLHCKSLLSPVPILLLAHSYSCACLVL